MCVTIHIDSLSLHVFHFWLYAIPIKILHNIHQIILYQTYVISIYKRFDFPDFQCFPAPSSFFAAYAKNTMDFQNL